MIFEECNDKNEWNNYILSNINTDILQSWEWGETKRIEAWTPYRFFLKNNEEIQIAAQILVKNTKFLGKIGYVPHGPVFQDQFSETTWNNFQHHLVSWAEKEGLIGIEIEPKISENSADTQNYKNSSWKISGRNRQPKYKLLVNLEKAEEEILGDMKKNTRYNIGYAERKGVEVNLYDLSHPDIESKIDNFYKLLLEMQSRTDGYPVRSRNYFDNLINSFKDTNQIQIFEARVGDEVVAMNISEFTDVWASSFYAGSSRNHSKLKPTYLLRWKSILEAKKRGCKIYDFWGIVPDSRHHKGYSDHKLSFGGERVDFVGIITKKLSWKFNLYELMLKVINLKTKLKYS